MLSEELKGFIGLDKDRVEKALRDNGVEIIRTGTMDTMFTMDYNPNRITIIYNEKNMVINISTG